MIFHYSYKLIQINRRRVKLQALQLHINSKTIDLQRVKTVIIFGGMVSARSCHFTHLFQVASQGDPTAPAL